MSSFVLVSGDRTWPLESRTSRRLRIEAFNVLVLNDCLRGTVYELELREKVPRWDVRVLNHEFTPYKLEDRRLIPNEDGWRPITRMFGDSLGFDGDLWVADKELWSAKAFLKYISKEAGGWFDNVVFGELSVKWLRPCIGKYYEYNDDGFAYEVLDEKSPGAFEVWTIPYTSTGEATS